MRSVMAYPVYLMPSQWQNWNRKKVRGRKITDL
jgi:hypothetical protein